MKQNTQAKRIEPKLNVQTFTDRLRYAIRDGSAEVYLQKDRLIDRKRNKLYTNRHTLGALFPDEDETTVLQRELLTLSADNYIETLEDVRFKNRSPWWVFGKNYQGRDVYIKLRVELVSSDKSKAGTHIFVMSFHYSDRKFSDSSFPYQRK